jgi:hypothetical protein
MKKIIILLAFILASLNADAHTLHYGKLKSLKFDLYRNDQYAGYHHIDLKWNDGAVEVKNTIHFGVKKLGITFYDYKSEGVEKYNKEGKLLNFSSETNDNGKLKFCRIKLDGDGYQVDGSKFSGTLKNPFFLGSYWNHDLITTSTQLSGITCKKISQTVKSLPDQKFETAIKEFQTEAFDIKGDNGLDTQVWYDKETKMLVHQILNKKGKWDYKLKSVEFSK